MIVLAETRAIEDLLPVASEGAPSNRPPSLQSAIERILKASVTSASWPFDYYDTADRPTKGQGGTGLYVYDALGRQTTVPAVDTPNYATDTSAGDITLGYFNDDLPRSVAQTVAGTSTSTAFTLDSNGRRSTATTTATSGTGTTTSSLVRHYSDSSDNPAWTVATDTLGQATTTRYAESIGGDLGTSINQDGSAALSVANLHGDVVTTIPITATAASTDAATGIDGWSDYTEYGAPRAGSSTTATSGTVGYGWLGAKQRSTTTETAGLTLMGVRFYNAASGRFTSLDPVPGGNATPYAYPNDPINMSDLDGKWGRWIRALRSGTVFDPRRTFGVGTCVFYCASLSCQGGAASFSFGGVGGYRQGIRGRGSLLRRHFRNIGGWGYAGFATRTVDNRYRDYYSGGFARRYGVYGNVGMRKNGRPNFRDSEIGVSAGYGAHLAGMRTHKTWDFRKRWHLVRKIYE